MARPRKAEKKAVLDARGQMLLPLAGANYVLRPSWEAIQSVEQQLQRSLVELSSEAVSGRLSVTDLAIIAAEFMRAAGKSDPKLGPSYSGARAERIAALIYEEGVPGINARIAVVLVGAVNGGYTAAGEPKPAT